MRFEALCIALLLPVVAWAGSGTPAFPDDAVLQRQQVPATELPTDAQAGQAERQAHKKFSDFDPARLAVPAFPTVPDQTGKGVDFSEVVENVNKAKQATQAEPDAPRLIVFVSFSMPLESLKRMAAQAERAGAAMVLRGLVEDEKGRPSFQATGADAGKLGMEKGQGFSVNPMVFRKYDIRQVPAFVLLTQNDCKTCGEDFIPEHLKIHGDVSLDYALRQMQRRRPGYEAYIQPYLERLQAGFFSGDRRDGGSK